MCRHRHNHDLRHTAASLALAKGVPLIDVARWLGHANPTTTLAISGHVVPDQRDRPAAAFENVGRAPLRAVS
jgi:integrase